MLKINKICLGVTFVLNLMSSQSVMAEFYVWYENGVKYVSMIPREGFNDDGSLKDEYNPNSFVYQYQGIYEYHNHIFNKPRNDNIRATSQNVARDPFASLPKGGSMEKYKETGRYEDLPEEVRLDNPNTDPFCRAEVNKLRVLEHNKEFETSADIRRKWENMIENLDRRNCNY